MKMRYYEKYFAGVVFCIILSMFILSCQPDALKKIRLKEEQLVEIMADLHIAKAALQRYPSRERDSIYQLFTAEIFEIHQVEKSRFEHDILQLEKDPESYLQILEKVSEKLKNIQDSVPGPEVEAAQ